MAPPKAPASPAADSGLDQENAFLAQCLKSMDATSKKIDMGAVAEALGYGNVKSAGNRFGSLKRKYSIPVDVFYPRSKSPAIPKVSPNKVQKSTAKRGRQPKAEVVREPESIQDDTDDDKPNEGEI
ncbi:uncharacterized protein N7482_003289 [Penicillium canariense]|uniref:Myb-like DNA-binding domain-containing protein n=1 Tax=Penicillium canariense TaxID=189055 RepID=A0A9W9LP64_9EURO|nr:uncharacterized protein N7482_003289 [Penicillium canariense]KAJ5167695.1 hypothetical protein N7482_003289 [Penicillium canariense]